MTIALLLMGRGFVLALSKRFTSFRDEHRLRGVVANNLL